MKRLCFFLILTFVSLTEARAQHVVEACFGPSYYPESFQTLNVFVNYSYGLYESPFFFLGVGTGLRYYLGLGSTPPGGEDLFSLSNCFQELAIPMFCHVQINLAKQGVIPYIGARTGANIPVVVRDYENERRSGMLFRGIFFEPLIGVSFGRKGRKRISTSIVSPFMNLYNTIEDTRFLSVSIMLSICYHF